MTAAVIREFSGFKLEIALNTYICGKRMRADLWPHLEEQFIGWVIFFSHSFSSFKTTKVDGGECM